MVYFTFMSATSSQEKVPLSAMEKVAWVEFVVALTASVVVLSLVPWLGDAATSGFALLGLVTLGYWFIRNRKKKTLVDERDREIYEKSNLVGMKMAWMFLVLSLIIIVMWVGRKESVSVMGLLNWLIWIQFVVWLVARSSVALLSYRKQRHAS